MCDTNKTAVHFHGFYAFAPAVALAWGNISLCCPSIRLFLVNVICQDPWSKFFTISFHLDSRMRWLDFDGRRLEVKVTVTSHLSHISGMLRWNIFKFGTNVHFNPSMSNNNLVVGGQWSRPLWPITLIFSYNSGRNLLILPKFLTKCANCMLFQFVAVDLLVIFITPSLHHVIKLSEFGLRGNNEEVILVI